MFGSIGGFELLLIFGLALLLFGPRKMPQIGRSIGRALSEFRGAAQEFKLDLEREVEIDELREVRTELDKTRKEIRNGVSSVARGSLEPDASQPNSTQPEGTDDGPQGLNKHDTPPNRS